MKGENVDVKKERKKEVPHLQKFASTTGLHWMVLQCIRVNLYLCTARGWPTWAQLMTRSA